MVGTRKVGSTAATQGATKSKINQGKLAAGFQQGSGKTSDLSRQHGGLKKKK